MFKKGELVQGMRSWAIYECLEDEDKDCLVKCQRTALRAIWNLIKAIVVIFGFCAILALMVLLILKV